MPRSLSSVPMSVLFSQAFNHSFDFLRSGALWKHHTRADTVKLLRIEAHDAALIAFISNHNTLRDDDATDFVLSRARDLFVHGHGKISSHSWSNSFPSLWNNYILPHDMQKVNSFDCKCSVNHLSDLQVAISCNTKSLDLIWQYVIVKVRHSDTNFTCG